MSSLTRSMSLVLDEFYQSLRVLSSSVLFDTQLSDATCSRHFLSFFSRHFLCCLFLFVCLCVSVCCVCICVVCLLLLLCRAQHVGVSAVTGDGMDGLFAAIDDAAKEFQDVYRPIMDRRRADRMDKEEARRKEQLERLQRDVQAESKAATTPSAVPSATPPKPATASTATARPVGTDTATPSTTTAGLSAAELRQLKQEYEDPDEGVVARSVLWAAPCAGLGTAGIPALSLLMYCVWLTALICFAVLWCVRVLSGGRATCLRRTNPSANGGQDPTRGG